MTRDRSLLRHVLFRWFLLRRGLTLGVRGLVRDPSGRVLLIRHSYVPGWHFPGGGVERGETAEVALQRELDEEAGIAATAPLVLHGLFHNPATFEGDHVALYLVPHWERVRTTVPNAEIREQGYFALDALPEGVTGATRRRLTEIQAGSRADAVW